MKFPPPHQPHNSAPISQSRRYRPVVFAPMRSLLKPTHTRRSAPLKSGQATSNPFCVAESPNSSAIDTPSEPIRSQLIKLTSKCSHAPAREGQWPRLSAWITFMSLFLGDLLCEVACESSIIGEAISSAQGNSLTPSVNFVAS